MPTKKESRKRASLGFQQSPPKIVNAPIKKKFRFENSFKICVSGAAGGKITQAALEGAYEVGRQIAMQGAVLITGATTGVPHMAAKGNYSVGGIAVGFSPASSALEHVKSYRLPTAYHDVIVYTGFNYAGRNLLLTRACDAIIEISGRLGTLNEFTIAFEDKKLIGVLEETGGMADHIRELLKIGQRKGVNVIFDNDPTRLVTRMIQALKTDYRNKTKIKTRTEAY
ncbi:MAG: hypothetical protein V1821_02640 [bacterium]